MVRTTPGAANDCSFVFLPADPTLLALARDVEREMQHKLEDEDLEPVSEQPDDLDDEDALADEQEGSFAPLGADLKPQAAVVSGTEVPDPDTAFAIEALARAQGIPVEQAWRRWSGTSSAPVIEEVTDEPDFQRRKRLRNERNKLVRRLHYILGQGVPFEHLHSQTNAVCAQGRNINEQTVQELERGNSLLQARIAAEQHKRRGGGRDEGQSTLAV